jgi:hypothetical protein
MRDNENLKYPYIRAWGKMMQSYDYYIESQIRDAIASKAPVDAIYRRDDGSWSRFADIEHEDTKQRVLSYLV